MKQLLKTFLLGILAGAAIALGAAANVAAKSLSDPIIGKILGAFLFPIGLIAVCTLGLFLYTGKIGYLVDNPKKDYVLSLLVGVAGNLVGAVLLGFICLLFDGFKDTATNFAIPLTSWLDVLEALAKGFVCGMFVFIAVDIYKKKGGVFGLLAVWLATATFVFIGAWHCIANMFYLTVSLSWNLPCIGTLLLVLIGNSLGSLFLRFILKLTEKKEETETKNS